MAIDSTNIAHKIIENEDGAINKGTSFLYAWFPAASGGPGLPGGACTHPPKAQFAAYRRRQQYRALYKAVIPGAIQGGTKARIPKARILKARIIKARIPKARIPRRVYQGA